LLVGAGVDGITGGKTVDEGGSASGETADGMIGCPIEPGIAPKVAGGNVEDCGRLDTVVGIDWIG
jgi:hypothetical protein